MSGEIFTPLEIDAIGEILNISLGSSATAISGLLNKRVDITTPNVDIVTFDEFEFAALEPATCVEITYTEGLEGNNIMLFKRNDIKAIVELLMSTEIPDEEFELNEMTVSAICEVMNQMMGASSTALSEFLGEAVNISTPVAFSINDSLEFKHKYFNVEDTMITVRFKLMIENVLESEFLCLLPIELAKRILTSFSLPGHDTEEETEKFEQQEAPPPEVLKVPDEPKIINVRQQAAYEPKSIDVNMITKEHPNNLNLIMSVPLQISVEIGRTKRPLKEILEFSQGTLVMLDKLAGDHVDLFVNGQCIAKGDVVVVDDSFGLKITEIVKPVEINE